MLSFFNKKTEVSVNNTQGLESILQTIYQNLDKLSLDEFKKLLKPCFEPDLIINCSFLDSLDQILKLIKKIYITPKSEKVKVTKLLNLLKIILIYKHTDWDRTSAELIYMYLDDKQISESIKIELITMLSEYELFETTDINQLLEYNYIDLLDYLIVHKLCENADIKFSSFLYFNKSISNLNYGKIQVKRDKINKILEFIFKRYEGNQSKNQLNVLIKNKIFNNHHKVKGKYKDNFSMDKHQKKNYLIPIHLLEVFEKCSNMNEIIVNFFGLYNKRLDRLVTKAFFKNSKINYDIFAWGLLIQPLKINQDILCNYLENNSFPDQLYTEDYVNYETNIFQNFYNDKRILNLISNLNKNEIHYMKDSIEMIKLVIEHNKKQTDPEQKVLKLVKKPKNFKEIHDYLALITTQLKQRNFALNSQEDILPIEEYRNSNLTIKVPLKNYDLIQIGQSLSICVGGGHYAKKINKNESYILTVFKDEKLTYCIELSFKNLNIIQAKSNFNKKVPSKDLDWIIQTINAFKENNKEALNNRII